jgi:hypothetical protein
VDLLTGEARFGGPFPADATSLSYGALPNQFTCHVIVALNGDSFLANSDVLCVYTHLFSGSPKFDFGLSLHESNTATLTWEHRFHDFNSAYVLLKLPMDGSPSSTQTLPAVNGTMTVTHDTRGAFTCFVLFSLDLMGEVKGNTNPICGIPGLASFPHSAVARTASVSPRRAADAVAARVRAAVPPSRVRSALHNVNREVEKLGRNRASPTAPRSPRPGRTN